MEKFTCFQIIRTADDKRWNRVMFTNKCKKLIRIIRQPLRYMVVDDLQDVYINQLIAGIYLSVNITER
ncbi:hypothetical protein RCL_jg21652.t1 [Rhizophagus clarus]|uniref:Uncharacterized protein n=1 Tax=Rhizophagus clarus TaxID=94130 RepID=A0A8H3L3Y3_9GLOM|nr:hypothetical protein RCL_jg21652.t1 [Rhizophagus clarus]